MTDHATRQAAIAAIIEAAMDNALDGDTSAAAITAANAVLEAIKPPPLVWESPCKNNNYCTIAKTDRGDYYVDVDGGRHQAWMESLTKPYEVQIGQPVGDMSAAKAAAQAHADAAFWAQSGLGRQE